jgi:hypothetical protein
VAKNSGLLWLNCWTGFDQRAEPEQIADKSNNNLKETKGAEPLVSTPLY